MVHLLDFGQFLDIWPSPVSLSEGQEHSHLSQQIRLVGLYLSTKYEGCRSNSKIHFDLEHLTLTLCQGHGQICH